MDDGVGHVVFVGERCLEDGSKDGPGMAPWMDCEVKLGCSRGQLYSLPADGMVMYGWRRAFG